MDIKDFKVTMKLMGNPFDPSPEDFNFAIKDDMFSFYPKGNLSFKDHSSVFLEYRAFNDGQEVDLSIDFYEETATSPTTFMVENSSGEKPLAQGLLAKELQINLIHKCINNQESMSSAIEGTIADVVTEVSSIFDLEDYIISSTVGKSIWYRPFMTEQDYIEKMLIPLAINEGDEFSPYFAFITSDNIFHFEDYASLMSKNTKESFIFSNEPEHNMDPSLLTSVIPFTQGSTDIKSLWNKTITTLNPLDFTEIETTRTLQDRLPDGSLIVGTNDKISNLTYGGIGDLETTFKQRVLGKDNLDSRKIFFQESLLITTARVFPNLHAGDTVDVNITVNNPDGLTSSYTSQESI